MQDEAQRPNTKQESSKTAKPPELASPGSPPAPEAGKLFDAVKLDFATIKTIVLTAAVVFCLLSIPFLWIMTKLVTFDDVDKRFKVIATIRPKILTALPEEVDTGYSKNFFINSADSDQELSFYSKEGERVTLTFQECAIRNSVLQPIKIQVNGQCPVPGLGPGVTQKDDVNLTDTLVKCKPDSGADFNTLKIVIPGGLMPGNKLQISLLVLVYQRVHEHLVQATQ
jgi:hypothetical protein